ncbi:hypothetical protein HDU82_003924 [Entophlyctis luteolus]|nr:hypothetical protein HDU82_003924 [Entophlyctis luteolus]
MDDCAAPTTAPATAPTAAPPAVALAQARIRAQHLTRLLAQAQDTIQAQATEVAVLKRALLDPSTLSSAAPNDTTALSSESSSSSASMLDVHMLQPAAPQASDDARDSHIAQLDALVAQKSSQVSVLESRLQASLAENHQLRERLVETERELQSARESASSLVDTMLVRASTAATLLHHKPTDPECFSQRKPASNVQSHTVSSAIKVKDKRRAGPAKKSTLALNKSRPPQSVEHQTCKSAADNENLLNRKHYVNGAKSPVLRKYRDKHKDKELVVHDATPTAATAAESVDAPDLEWKEIVRWKPGMRAKGHAVAETELLQRAVKAETERDALEEELLNLLKEFNRTISK